MAHRTFLVLTGAILAAPTASLAHAFGQQFTLPLPVSFYVVGGLSAFVASCVVLLFFADPRRSRHSIVAGVPFGPRTARIMSGVFALAGLAAFFAAIGVGLFGVDAYALNPLPNFFWVIFLVLFVYVNALIGGLWERLDPFRRITAAFASGEETGMDSRWLHFLPVVFLFGLLWLELLSPGWGISPFILGALLACYALAMAVGSGFFGVSRWFSSAELFSTFFGLVGRVAPIQLEWGKVSVQPPGERLVEDEPRHIGTLLFIVLMLGSTVLDGLRETRVWWNVTSAFPGVSPGTAQGIALVLVPLFLLALYVLAIGGMKTLAGSRVSLHALSLRFAYSLVPIAVAYHFAHYFSLIFDQGQRIVPQLSDPLSRGWDLFGTANYQFRVGVLGADTVWYLQLGAIVLGHILAAVVVHRISRRLFATKRAVVLSQVPMLVLMVLFTAFGLWTLAQPFFVV